MATESPKRRASPSSDRVPPTKRPRTDTSSESNPVNLSAKIGDTVPVPEVPNEYNVHREGLQRSIALALDHVGFDTASEEAMESFTTMTETYLASLIENVAMMANHARRSTAIAPDFELSFGYFNINLTDLSKHRRPAVAAEKSRQIELDYEVERDKDGQPTKHDKAFNNLPCLDEELSGQPDKDAKSYIPKSFPDFPSTHTYKYTATDIESVTVRDDTFATANGKRAKTVPDWRGDPKKIRETAAVQAKQAEEALRKLVRASKMASLKDLRSIAEKNPLTKTRYDLWEDAMKDLLQEGGLTNGREDAGREDVADHSVIVNAQKKYHRREIPRSAKRMGDGISGKG